MANGALWHTRPIFITSTFRDMQAERDWLRDRVFPELEERLRARRTHLEPIDLRLGVGSPCQSIMHGNCIQAEQYNGFVYAGIIGLSTAGNRSI